MAGPLAGIRIIELAGIGPCPFAGMVLADMGADVVRVERSSSVSDAAEQFDAQRRDPTNRSKRSIALDLKTDDGPEAVLRLCEGADALIEGFRPGVIERMGLGPDVLLARNERLVVGRMTGWGQRGTVSRSAGHDINYIALSGALHGIGHAGGPPEIPLNLVGDFGGGGMLLVTGVLAGLLRARISGKGDVVDAAMTDGSALLTTMIHGFIGEGMWKQERGVNLLDGGAPFYSVYQTSDGGYVSVGCLEPHFYTTMIVTLGLGESPAFSRQYDRAAWPEMRRELDALFRTKDRDHWERTFLGSEACVVPILTPSQAVQHPHNVARGTFLEINGVSQPAPAPRFAVNVPSEPTPAAVIGADGRAILHEAGYTTKEIAELLERGVLAVPDV